MNNVSYFLVSEMKMDICHKFRCRIVEVVSRNVDRNTTFKILVPLTRCIDTHVSPAIGKNIQ